MGIEIGFVIQKSLIQNLFFNYNDNLLDLK